MIRPATEGIYGCLREGLGLIAEPAWTTDFCRGVRRGVRYTASGAVIERSQAVAALKKSQPLTRSTSNAEIELLRGRVYRLEAIARLNGETIWDMQSAADQADREGYSSRR
jgi:hypothetical protein